MTRDEMIEVMVSGGLHLHRRRGDDKQEWVVTVKGRKVVCADNTRCIKPEDVMLAVCVACPSRKIGVTGEPDLRAHP